MIKYVFLDHLNPRILETNPHLSVLRDSLHCQVVLTARSLRHLLPLAHSRVLARAKAHTERSPSTCISQSKFAQCILEQPDSVTDVDKWLTPRRNIPPQNSYAYYGPQPNAGYGMNNYPEPPPVYSNGGMPPVYQPPPGGSKIAPQQNGTV